MSHDYSTAQNKQQKVRSKQYLPNFGEPWDDISSDSPLGFETKLLENTSSMRHRFRHIALKLRNHYTLVPKVQTSDAQRIERHYAELQRVDELEMVALNTKVTKMKTKLNSKRHKHGMLPII